MTNKFENLKPGDVVLLHPGMLMSGARVGVILEHVDSVTRNGIYKVLVGENVITCVDTAFQQRI
jgi:hypothetical protein